MLQRSYTCFCTAFAWQNKHLIGRSTLAVNMRNRCGPALRLSWDAKTVHSKVEHVENQSCDDKAALQLHDFVRRTLNGPMKPSDFSK